MSERGIDIYGIRQCVMSLRDGTQVRWLQVGYQDNDTRLVTWRDVPEYHVPTPESPK